MKQRILALAAALCLAVGLAVPAAAAAYPEMTTDYFYTILNSAASSKNGVAVSADGGGDARIQAEISAALEALFHVPQHKIRVLKRVE